MNFPRINTMTTEMHTGDVQRLRFVVLNGSAAYFLAKDVGSLIGLRADDDGDYRSVLEQFGISFFDAVVSDQSGPIGSHALITEQDYKRLIAEAIKRLAVA
ncbi:hypothetical protein CO653_33395 [Rhizobium anhuiense]|uniref:Prophage antirepressor-like protein n=1 Tax=Rhizobium lentis TaxID=1138194 RepID=A0A7W9CXG9_9HYPH|nr:MULTISPECIES: hypothetical protein [Rhizobium]MBB4576612.1 prophage antirepressor-like protein [Rhizobium lentis]MBB5553021.1 prophage antirepressor-like protein [Rhizobium lentis]MBB5563460.1 prophage antirepressor-like protein [Rhizobium lentis]MBB5569998.1 prophage antirepressor-like protein [Rhizobium lentis]PDS61396.1 hypothetical protein CO653_33395 [Rhizobium anhuiense]